MSKKNIKLGIILIVLLALAYLYQGPFQKWRIKAGVPENFLANIEFEQIDKIEIKRNGETTALERQGERWKVGGTKDFYVREDVAARLNQSLEQIKEAELELVSSNKDNKKDFQTDEAGLSVKIYQGGEIAADFIIGKMGSDFKSTYITRPEIDNTYAININLRPSFDQVEWRDKTVFSSDREKINKLRFQYPDREFVVEKQEEIWVGVSPYNFAVDEEKIAETLDVMSNLTAVNIPEQDFNETGLEKNLIIVQATGEGVDNTLMVGLDNSEELFYVKKGDSDNIYLISGEQRNGLDKKIRDFK